jgi:hypothetical protein
MAGEIISERRATSNRNGGRDHLGIPGDFRRNQQADLVDRIIRFALIAIAAPSAYRPMRLAVERAVFSALSLDAPIGSGLESPSKPPG